METRKEQPLVTGLIGHKSGLVYAQMEVYTRDQNTLELIIRRTPYSNLPNIEFSIDDRDVEEIIDILKEAKKKLDALWISRLAATESRM